MDHLSRRLENYMVQATLIIGFALTALGAETFSFITQHTSPFCIWKSASHKAIGMCFILCTSTCVCLCIIVVVASSHLLHVSNKAALNLSAKASLDTLRMMTRRISLVF